MTSKGAASLGLTSVTKMVKVAVLHTEINSLKSETKSTVVSVSGRALGGPE